MKRAEQDKYVAKALRILAVYMAANPSLFSVEVGKAMDRALRCCRAIEGIHLVWVRWHYVAEQNGWLTEHELTIDLNGYKYPDFEE